MPELPEVETTVRGLARHLQGKRITSVELRREGLRRPFPDGLVQMLAGARVVSLSRRAKYGIIETDRGHALIFHLGMSGRWRIDPAQDDRHDHLVLSTADHRFALCDPRRFGSVDLVNRADLAGFPPFARLGPEPLAAEFTAGRLAQACAGRRTSIKACLLDQAIVAGLGNIYVCEALWRARLDPRKAAGRLAAGQYEHLVEAIREVLQEAITAGGSSLRDFASPDGELGYFSTRFSVYGREGQACHRDDGGTIIRITQAGRSSWYCPAYQSRSSA